MADRIGYYGLAKRDLDRGGESVTIVSELPVAWEEVNRVAVERDRLELASDPNSPYRYFPTELTDEELADLGIKRGAVPVSPPASGQPSHDSKKGGIGRRRLVAAVLALLALAALVAMAG